MIGMIRLISAAPQFYQYLHHLLPLRAVILEASPHQPWFLHVSTKFRGYNLHGTNGNKTT